MIYKIANQKFDFSKRTLIMGVLNVTPDSFSDGGIFFSINNAIRRGIEIENEGADFIDIGGESTRPNSKKISVDEELRRVIPVIENLAKKISIPISIDTYKSKVAYEAINYGATIVNDISGFSFDKKICRVISKYNITPIISHIKGTPQNMQVNPTYKNVVDEVKKFLSQKILKAKEKNIKQIFIDVGIGFGKNLTHNLLLLKHLKKFKSIGFPILIGTSRKSFIGQILNEENPLKRFEGTCGSVAVAILNGANVVRIHDVKKIKKVVQVIDAILKTK